MTHYLYSKLTEEELKNLWADVYLATRYIAPSGIMFASDTRTDGLTLMAEHNIKEGMQLAAWYIRWQKGHGSGRRIPPALRALEKYGANAKHLIPYLEEHAEHFVKLRNPRRGIGPDDKTNLIKATIEKIKNSVYKPKLISISKYIDKKDIPPRNGP